MKHILIWVALLVTAAAFHENSGSNCKGFEHASQLARSTEVKDPLPAKTRRQEQPEKLVSIFRNMEVSKASGQRQPHIVRHLLAMRISANSPVSRGAQHLLFPAQIRDAVQKLTLQLSVCRLPMEIANLSRMFLQIVELEFLRLLIEKH